MRAIFVKILIFFSIFTYSTCVYSQDGTPFITHYKEIKNIESQNLAISQDDQNVMLFANRRGLISFDGKNWNLIKLPYIPFAVKRNPIDKKIYIGANNNYGYLERDTKGFYTYVSLSSDSVDIGIISKIIFNDSIIYFYGDQSITRYHLFDSKVYKRWSAKENKPFTGMFCTNKNTFFNVYGTGLYRLESDTLFPIVTGFYTENNEILFSLPYNKSRVLVGTDDSKLYTFDGIKYYNYDINDEGYLEESILSDGQIISDTLYAFGTLYGGVEVVNKKTGKIVYTVNYQNGLPDDEIYALGLDNNNGLWLSHEYGVSRVDFNLSVRNYSTYPGLKGNLLSSIVHSKVLYVATNEGVFYLSEVKDFSEAEVWVKKRVRTSSTNTSSTKTANVSQTETKKPVKKLFSRLFNKDNDKAKDDSKKEVKRPVPKYTTKTKYVKRKVSTLKSINYVFKKIENLNEKCTQLVSTDIGVLVASNTGLYNINKFKSEKLVSNTYINQIGNKTLFGNYFVATDNGVLSVYNEKDKWKVKKDLNVNEPVYSVNIVKKDQLWFGSDDVAILILIDSTGKQKEEKRYTLKTDFPEQFKLDFINDTVIALLENGLYFYNAEKDTFQLYKNFSNTRFIADQKGFPWVQIDGNWVSLNSNPVWSEQEGAYLKLFDDVSSIISDKEDNLWVINNNKQIYKIIHEKYNYVNPAFDIYYSQIINEEGTNFELSDLNFDSKNKAIYIKIIAPYYVKENSTYYQYFVEGLMNDWSNWSIAQDINLIINPGKYTLHVRAKDIWGNKSELKSIEFSIKPPFTETTWFYILIALAMIVSFILIVKLREKKLKHDKKVLEKKVKERTLEIQEKAKEIETQRDEIMGQRDEIISQKDEITDSINYASRIQKAVLPLQDHFDKAFSDHFILYKPRDIVSGDFYWIAEDEDKLYFTAADCTGHGVPGAFMSMLGVSSLNEIFGNENINLTASKILNLLREKIKFSLHQTGKEGENKDGMDMAMCIYHKKKSMIEYAGAYNPLYLFRNGELQVHKADRMPIGIYHVEKESFTNHEIKIQKGDVIYIFSDGYVDQFGGPGQTKFKAANFKKLLLEINEKPMKEQQQILDERFAKWKGDLDQIDDVILIGIRF
jgi:serine phosphatase RsbU (regulator of sigma subunit)